MIDGYASYVAYFRKMAWQHMKLRGSFYVGDSWRIMGAQRSAITYPAMWLERPVIRPQFAPDGDSLRMRVEGALSIVAGVATDDYDKQEFLLQVTQTIVQQIVNRMKHDADLDEFDLVIDATRLDPLAVLMADDVHGWRIEFQMVTKGWDDCFVEEDVWSLLDGAGNPNLPIDPDYLPFVEGPTTLFDCAGTIADFVLFYDAGKGLMLTDCSTYVEGDRRRDVYYTITDGITTLLVPEYHRWVSEADLATLNSSVLWTITQLITTRQGCASTRVYTFSYTGVAPPPAASPIRWRNDTLAKASGLKIGQSYLLSFDNDYAWPEGSVKQITEP